MNETLSDEIFKKIKNNAQEGFSMTFKNEVLHRFINTIEELKAEKVEYKEKYREAMLDNEFLKPMVKAKDARIKQLVEALNSVSNWLVCIYMCEKEEIMEEALRQNNNIEKALSTIPDVEGYRLEREVINTYLKQWTLAYTDSEIDLNLKSAINITLFTEYQNLLAHREKVKNVSS